jgi:2-polyprenyl-6-hydroxyphenyl methylase/3-demethylubiquinone-9 3-methyltransferase
MATRDDEKPAAGENYYRDSLSAERLRRCYELAPPRVRRYLEAEIDHVLARLAPGSRVLELGCGYGRVLRRLLDHAALVVGIDSSTGSLRLACDLIGDRPSCRLMAMDAANLGLADRLFDGVVCIQNGISAFHVDQRRLVSEAMRVTRRGGILLLSSYSESFWEERLEWFRIQAAHGLIGEIDPCATRDGVIVCKDGFTATTFSPRDFEVLFSGSGVVPRITEVDRSSLFCEVRVE